MTGLKIIDSSSHITICNEEHGMKCLFCNFDFLIDNNMFQTFFNITICQLIEPENNASTLNWLNNLSIVVAT